MKQKRKQQTITTMTLRNAERRQRRRAAAAAAAAICSAPTTYDARMPRSSLRTRSLFVSHSFHGNNNNTWERSTNNIASVGQKQSSHVHTHTHGRSERRRHSHKCIAQSAGWQKFLFCFCFRVEWSEMSVNAQAELVRVYVCVWACSVAILLAMIHTVQLIIY